MEESLAFGKVFFSEKKIYKKYVEKTIKRKFSNFKLLFICVMAWGLEAFWKITKFLTSVLILCFLESNSFSKQDFTKVEIFNAHLEVTITTILPWLPTLSQSKHKNAII